MMEIRVEGLCKSYGGKPVLTNLTAVFRPGITCVSAPSGTGKTTLLRLLLGLERPDGGSIRAAAGPPYSRRTGCWRTCPPPEISALFWGKSQRRRESCCSGWGWSFRTPSLSGTGPEA